MSKTIMGIQLQQRYDTAKDVQELLTKYGCIIKTRLGVHQASDCSEQGIIIIEFLDNTEDKMHEMEEGLSDIDDVIVKKMVF